MKVIDRINSSNKPLFTFELLPPPKGKNIQILYDAIDRLMEFSPAYINITYHQHEEVYKDNPDGTFEKRMVWKRPGTVAISASIQHRYGVDVVPHLICGGLTRQETENILIDLNFLGIENLLVLRGDPPKTQRNFSAEKNGHSHAVELLRQVADMNKGKYLDEEIQNTTASNFCLGVAGYPEKHSEAPNMATDLKFLKEKVDAGAEYIVTQMFFDNSKYIDFVKRCREMGISVPIVPGLKPITTLNDIKLLPKIFSIDIPEALSKELDKCTTNKEAWKVGVDWCIAQSKGLIDFGVPSLHYYTIGIAENIKEIAKAVF